MPKIEIRDATIEDCALILKFIKELATYEKVENEVIATEADIRDALFGEDSTASALICRIDNVDIGFAVYFFNYSTWQGKRGLYVEDLYVSPSYRGAEAGKAILKYLATVALSQKCGRFEWSVLDWNEPAIQFYQSIGAKPLNEWVRYRLAGNALENFANS